MRNLILGIVASALMATSAHSDEVWGAIDFSDSVPVLLEDDVAARAGKTLAEAVRRLGPGDKFFLRSFGEAGVSETQLHLNVKMAGRTRPQHVARDLEPLIASLPERVRQGTLTVEHRTNVMGWLERVGPTLNCLDEPTRLVVFTDAIEWSAAIRGDDMLQGTPLPPPSGKILEGCAVEFWGVGQQQKKYGNDDRWYPILRKSWTAYMEQAGAASFKAFADYSR